MRYCSVKKILFIWRGGGGGSSDRKADFLFSSRSQRGDGGFNPSPGYSLLSGHGLGPWGSPARGRRRVPPSHPGPAAAARGARWVAPEARRRAPNVRPPRPALTAATVPEGAGSHFPPARWGAARWGRRHLSPRMREGTPSRRLKLGGRGGGGRHEWQFNPAAISCRVKVGGEAARFDKVLRGYVVRRDLSYVADEAQVALQEENSL